MSNEPLDNNVPSPDEQTIQNFLAFATKGWRGQLGDQEVVVEISVISNDRGRYQKSFDLIDGWEKEAAVWAAGENVQNSNLYWLPQPKRSEARGKVASDEDIYCVMNLFIDRDDKARVPLSTFAAEPAWIVHTGSIPHDRDHAYYRLSKPDFDFDKWRATQQTLAKVGNGDPNCTNPARIMRLPGTVSWPPERKKARGYVPEFVTWSEQSPSALNLATYSERFGVDEFCIGSKNPRSSLSLSQQARAASNREVNLDREIIDLLRSRRNSLASGSYEIWRDICFGTLDKYRGTSLEKDARSAFYSFSNRWGKGDTKDSDIDKLWFSEDEGKSKRVTAGSAIFHLKKLPILAPLMPDMMGRNHHVPIEDTIELKGLAGRFHSLLVEATDREPGDLQTGGALVTLSALVGPVATISNGVAGKCCTNLYVLSLAPTGSGKEVIRSLVSSVLKAAGRQEEAFDGSPSDVSFHYALTQSAGRSCMMIDEAGILAKAMKSQSQSWQRMLISILMKVYGLGLTRLAERKYKDKRKNIAPVEEPRPTLLLTSTIIDFTEGTSQEDSSSGFFNRMVTFVEHALPPLRNRNDSPNKQAVIDLPDDVVTAVKRISGYSIGPQIPNKLPQISVVLIDDAREKLLDFKHGDVEVKVKSGGLVAETWGRAVENAQRIAGLLAVSDALVNSDCSIGRLQDPQVEFDVEYSSLLPNAPIGPPPASLACEIQCNMAHVKMAIAIMTRGLVHLEEIARNAGQQKSFLKRTKNDVIEYLKKQGGNASQAEITREPLRGMGLDPRNQLIAAMVEDGEILETEEKQPNTSGPNPTIYALPNTSQATGEASQRNRPK